MKYTATYLDDVNWIRFLSIATLKLEIKEIMGNFELAEEDKRRLLSMRHDAIRTT